MVQKDRNAAKRCSIFSEIPPVEDTAGSDSFFFLQVVPIYVCAKDLIFFSRSVLAFSSNIVKIV